MDARVIDVGEELRNVEVQHTLEVLQNQLDSPRQDIEILCIYTIRHYLYWMGQREEEWNLPRVVGADPLHSNE